MKKFNLISDFSVANFDHFKNVKTFTQTYSIYFFGLK